MKYDIQNVFNVSIKKETEKAFLLELSRETERLHHPEIRKIWAPRSAVFHSDSTKNYFNGKIGLVHLANWIIAKNNLWDFIGN